MTTTPDRNAAADVLAAMWRYNSNPQQSAALDLAIRLLRAGGEPVAWMVEAETAGAVSAEMTEATADLVIANVTREYGNAYGKITKRPLYAAPSPAAAQPERAGGGEAWDCCGCGMQQSPRAGSCNRCGADRPAPGVVSEAMVDRDRLADIAFDAWRDTPAEPFPGTQHPKWLAVVDALLAALNAPLAADASMVSERVERAAAEQAYTMQAFDYATAPVGSRDWTLYWRGWWGRVLHGIAPPAADGMVLVPREPTEAMRATFRAEQPATTFYTHTTLQCADFDSRYRAMLAAAPRQDGTEGDVR
jgi:hypothetical protein